MSVWIEREVAYCLPLAVGLAGVACTTLAQALTHRKLRARPSAPLLETELPPITVLKPLKGCDEGLYENLSSIARQDYPRFEIAFCLEDARDPALAVAQRVRREHPQVPMQVVIKPARDALNPKVSNLLNAIDRAAHDCVLISDSNVRVDPSYLRAIASELQQPGVGLVSNLIVGVGEASLGALLENLQLGTFIIAGVCFGDACGHPIVVGKSMLLRRSQLQQLGGLSAVADVLAEDYMLGQRYHAAGYRVVLSAHRIETLNAHSDLMRFAQRHLRWAQLRRWCGLSTFFAELLLYPVPWLLAAMALFSARDAGARDVLSGEAGLALAMCALAFKVMADCLLVWDVRRVLPSALALVLLPLRECALVALWCTALVRRTVVWRGHRRRIGAGSVLERAEATPPVLGEVG